MSPRARKRDGVRCLRLGLPKGSLQETTQKLFGLAGFDLRVAGRSYYPEIDDPDLECVLIRAQEMARYVEQGVLDAGITGLDWTQENRARVVELADLEAPWPNYNPVRWVVAVKEDSKIRGVTVFHCSSNSLKSARRRHRGSNGTLWSKMSPRWIALTERPSRSYCNPYVILPTKSQVMGRCNHIGLMQPCWVPYVGLVYIG